MYRIKKAVILVMLVVCPVMAAAQTCLTNTIPATTPTERFTINPNGTATDSRTGLMWQRCGVGQSGVACSGEYAPYTLQGALQYVQNLNASGGFAGYTDWRLPNIKELNTIVEEQCYDPALNLTVFPNTVPIPNPNQTYWVAILSSTPHAYSSAYHWVVNFGFGRTSPGVKVDKYNVRLVR